MMSRIEKDALIALRRERDELRNNLDSILGALEDAGEHGQDAASAADAVKRLHVDWQRALALASQVQTERDRLHRKVGDLMQPLPDDSEEENVWKMLQIWSSSKRQEKDELRRVKAARDEALARAEEAEAERDTAQEGWEIAEDREVLEQEARHEAECRADDYQQRFEALRGDVQELRKWLQETKQRCGPNTFLALLDRHPMPEGEPKKCGTCKDVGWVPEEDEEGDYASRCPDCSSETEPRKVHALVSDPNPDCQTCKGRGHVLGGNERNTVPVACPECFGAIAARESRKSDPGKQYPRATCGRCKDGEFAGLSCVLCMKPRPPYVPASAPFCWSVDGLGDEVAMWVDGERLLVYWPPDPTTPLLWCGNRDNWRDGNRLSARLWDDADGLWRKARGE